MKFTHIIWFMMCLSLGIGLINSMGIFSVDYMTVPEGSTWQLTDVNGTLNNANPISDGDLSLTSLSNGLGFLKDMVVGVFYVYGDMVSIWHMPAALATVLQTIIAVSWLLFFVQILTRFSWGGVES